MWSFWMTGWPPPPSMKKTTDLAPANVRGSLGQPSRAITGKTPGVSLRSFIRTAQPAKNSSWPAPDQNWVIYGQAAAGRGPWRVRFAFFFPFLPPPAAIGGGANPTRLLTAGRGPFGTG